MLIVDYFRTPWNLEDLLNDIEAGEAARNHLVRVFKHLRDAWVRALLGYSVAYTEYQYASICFGLLLAFLSLFPAIPREVYAIGGIQDRNRALFLNAAFVGGGLVAFLCDPQEPIVAVMFGYAMFFAYFGHACEWHSGSGLQAWCLSGYVGGLIAVSVLYAVFGVFSSPSVLLEMFVVLMIQLNPLLLAYVYPYSYGIVLRVRNGEDDDLSHASRFFTDFPAIYFNLCVKPVIDLINARLRIRRTEKRRIDVA